MMNSQTSPSQNSLIVNQGKSCTDAYLRSSTNNNLRSSKTILVTEESCDPDKRDEIATSLNESIAPHK